MAPIFRPSYLTALHASPPGVTLPTEEWESNEPPLETDRHRDQISDLISTLKWWWRHRRDFYVSGNLTIYYNLDQKTNQDFRGPDFFVILNAELRDRKSWMVWRENYLYPNLIVELLSSSTASTDRNTKKDLYQDQFQTPEYFWFDPHIPEDPGTLQEFKGFRLIEGQYRPIPQTEQGWMWSEQLQLYLGVYDHRLRFFTANGERLPTSEERAEQERQAKEQERREKEQERREKEQERQAKEQERREKEQERQRAEQAEQRAEQAEQQAEQERRDREQAQQQIEQLRQRLRDLGLDLDP